jgi:DNA-binding transcriptional ArsR family regulator
MRNNITSEHNQERDMDLIRLMLIAHVTGENPSELEQYDRREILYHYTLLKDAGFIDAKLVEGNDVTPEEVAYVRVTWAGQEFYDASKESKIWKLAKENVLKPGASFTATALLEWLKREVRKQVIGG